MNTQQFYLQMLKWYGMLYLRYISLDGRHDSFLITLMVSYRLSGPVQVLAGAL